MGEVDEAAQDVADTGRGRPERPGSGEALPRRIVVDKRTHRVRLENETESEVTVVIEEKGGRG